MPRLPMSPLRPDKIQIRASINRSVYDLLKGLSGVKQIGLSDLVAEALDRYLEDEDNQTLIEYHRLDKSEVDGTERRHSD